MLLLKGKRECSPNTRISIGETVSTYSYDGNPGANGLMSSMTGFEVMNWDPYNQLSTISTQRINQSNPQTPEMTYYRYDRYGNRVRKVIER